MPPNEDSDIGVWDLHDETQRTVTAGKTSRKKLTFLTPSSRLFQLTDFVRCMRTLLNWVSKSLIQVQKSVMQVQSCSFALNLTLLLFDVLVDASPSSLLSTQARSLHVWPRARFIACAHWTNTGNVYGTKIFKPKKIGGYPTENFFGKLSTLENIVPWEEGKKSSDKKNHTTENSQKI